MPLKIVTGAENCHRCYAPLIRVLNVTNVAVTGRRRALPLAVRIGFAAATVRG